MEVVVRVDLAVVDVVEVVVASEVAGAPVLNIVLSTGEWTVILVASPVQRLYLLVFVQPIYGNLGRGKRERYPINPLQHPIKTLPSNWQRSARLQPT